MASSVVAWAVVTAGESAEVSVVVMDPGLVEVSVETGSVEASVETVPALAKESVRVSVRVTALGLVVWSVRKLG